MIRTHGPNLITRLLSLITFGKKCIRPLQSKLSFGLDDQARHSAGFPPVTRPVGRRSPYQVRIVSPGTTVGRTVARVMQLAPLRSVTARTQTERQMTSGITTRGRFNSSFTADYFTYRENAFSPITRIFQYM